MSMSCYDESPEELVGSWRLHHYPSSGKVEDNGDDEVDRIFAMDFHGLRDAEKATCDKDDERMHRGAGTIRMI